MLIRSAWHNPACWSTVQSKLEAQDYYSVAAVKLPSSGADTPPHKDVDAVPAASIPLMNADKEIVIVEPSYGGIPACASTEEYSEEGKKGGVRSILFVAAIPTKRMTQIQTFDGTHAPSEESACPQSCSSHDAVDLF